MLDAILPDHGGPTEVVPVDAGDPDEGSTDGIESRSAVVASLSAAQDALARHDFDRVLTLGGDCSVSVAPFAALAEKYGDDLAVVWIDAHPDTDTPETGYDGYHAMAVSTLLGHGDEQIVDQLPAVLDPDRFAYAGMHAWEEDAYTNVAAWGLTSFGPDSLRETRVPLLEWLTETGASRVAIHFDVDTVDSDDAVFGLGKAPGGLTRAQVTRVLHDIGQRFDIVGLTIAAFNPRDVLMLQSMIRGFPLVG